MIVEIAPAKVNLYLHVGPVRGDGLHDLESLFFFTDQGDVVRVERADDIGLEIIGPFAAPLLKERPDSNLVFRSATALRNVARDTMVGPLGAKITLEKNLPVAAGIGGGSADAAATLRALLSLWGMALPKDTLTALAFSLGADVPACLSARPQRVSGAGETLSKVAPFPPLHICLVNPGIETPTGPIFKAFDAKKPSPPPPISPALSAISTKDGISAAFRQSRNDLEIFAIEQYAIIGEVIDFLASCRHALGARMSGSGATCFALFETKDEAELAARNAEQRGWWSAAMRIAG